MNTGLIYYDNTKEIEKIKIKIKKWYLLNDYKHHIEMA